MRTRTAHFVQISISKRIVRVMLGCGYLAAFVAVPLAALWPAADVNEDVNAMIGAADRGDTATIAALLRGELAAVDCRDETGMTPLMAAARAGRTESCRELLAAGATINTSASFHGRFYATPLMLATTGGHHDVLRVLIAHGADVYAAGPNGRTALATARRADDAKAVEILVAAGARNGKCPARMKLRQSRP